MKKIENKQIKKNKFSHYCRAVLLSLFVILTIPSISSGIFGNGDAEAACVPTTASPTFAMIDSIANDPSFCGGSDTSACTTNTLTIGTAGENVCVSVTGTNPSCKAPTSSVNVKCATLNPEQCKVVSGYCAFILEDTQNNKLVDAVCRVYQIATGTAGKAFAAVGVISVGIGFFTGKVSWGLMISVAAGIAVFFGAPSIIAVISGDQNATSLCSNVI